MATTLQAPSSPASVAAPAKAPQPVKVAEERHWRSIAKAISWRAVGTIDTMIISYLITGRIKLAVSIGCVELFTKILLFYLHERVWQRIPYGRLAETE
jgi:uncharacterized membrane protein